MPQSPARDALVSQAITSIGKALEIDPDAAHAKNNIGVAMQMLPAASPASMQLRYDAHLTTGTFLSQHGRFDQAVAEFRGAVEIFPKSVEAHIYLGLGLAQANKKPEGIAELRAAKELDAKQANEILSKALHLPADERNFDGFIEQAMR